MADFGKFKKNSLGAPPSMEEVKNNLSQPEIAPQPSIDPKAIAATSPKATPIEKAKPTPSKKVDELKSTVEQGSVIVAQDESDETKILRTKPLATKVTPEFHKRLKTLAATHELDMVEIIEQAVELWIVSRNV